MKRIRASQQGFSLVELMVAMAIGLMMTAVVVTVFSRSSKTSAVTQTLNEMQEQARVALDMMQRDVRLAGYIGCNSNRLLDSGGLDNTISAPNNYLNNLAQFLRGHEGTGAAFAPVAPAAVTGAAPVPVLTSDALIVRVVTGAPVAVSATMANGTAIVPVFSTAGFAANTRAVVSNCDRAVAFMVTGTVGGLNHSAGANAVADLGRAFNVDATVTRFQTVAYYLGTSSLDPAETSLWRRVDQTAASEEIAIGAESFQVQYGLDTNADEFADLWQPANAVPTWDDVVAVRISLLMRSRLAEAAQANQQYDFNGTTNIAAGDRRLRRPFNITIQLRNRSV